MIIKKLFSSLIVLFLIFFVTFLTQAAKAKTPKSGSKASKPVTETDTKIKLAKDEYLIQYNHEKDVRFKTKEYENLELSTNCFKFNKPKCQAFEKSLLGTKEKHTDHMISPSHNNWGAIHCPLIGGENVLVKTSQGNESDFCQFKDGSLVSSWSAYYKTNR